MSDLVPAEAAREGDLLPPDEGLVLSFNRVGPSAFQLRLGPLVAKLNEAEGRRFARIVERELGSGLMRSLSSPGDR